MKIIIPMALIAALFFSPVFANKLAPPECETEANTHEMTICVDWHYNIADRRLNQIYGTVKKTLDDDAKKLLQDSQRAWIKYRDAECKKKRDLARGGSIAPLIQISCLTGLSQVRARELALIGEEGGGVMIEPPFPTAFERQGSAQLGAFTCGQKILEARIGLLPAALTDNGLVKARLTIGSHRLEWPVGGDGQNAFCGADIYLSVIRNKDNPSCPALRVEDGLCDAFFVHWNKTTKAFEWNRN